MQTATETRTETLARRAAEDKARTEKRAADAARWDAYEIARATYHAARDAYLDAYKARAENVAELELAWQSARTAWLDARPY